MDPLDGSPEQIQASETPRSDLLSPAIATALEERLPAVPDYDLLRRIGRGAYGDVWLGRSQATGVLRAVKIVWRQRFEDDRPFQREFEGIQKFERISREHPSQLALFHIGRNQEEGYFYYVMELADPVPAGHDVRSPTSSLSKRAGATLEKSEPPDVDSYNAHTLRADLSQGRLPAARVVEVGLALAEALGHLHQHGLVHRDVKPSNVIFVNGRPKLADIGLVTDASDQCSIVGTEGYLPPEGPGTPQADIFALGKVLYEAATGLDRRQFPDLPSDARTWPDAASALEINQVVLKACTAQAQQRYGTAQEMEKDLARLAGGKSVLRAHRAARRWRLARSAAVWLVAAAAVIGLIYVARRFREPSSATYIEKPSTNALANHYFELGRTHFDIWRGTNFQIASDYFKQAIALDTNFAAAYGFLAATYFWSDEGWNPGWKFLPQAKTVAQQALALDERLAEPHLALGWYYGIHEWNWSEAERQDKRAVALNDGSSFCHLCYAELLRVMGRTNDALQQIYRARSLDPNSRIINVRLVHYLMCARRFKDASDQIERAIAMGYGVPWDRLELSLALGQADGALEATREDFIGDGVPREKAEHDVADAKRAVAVEGVKAIWRLRLKSNNPPVDDYWMARCYAQLGETNRAFDCLGETLKAHDHDVSLTFNVMTDWALDPIRSDKRFHAILQTMHFE